jgi:hypothetical protein
MPPRTLHPLSWTYRSQTVARVPESHITYDSGSNLWHLADDRAVRTLRRVTDRIYVADWSGDTPEDRQQLRVELQETCRIAADRLKNSVAPTDSPTITAIPAGRRMAPRPSPAGGCPVRARESAIRRWVEARITPHSAV